MRSLLRPVVTLAVLLGSSSSILAGDVLVVDDGGGPGVDHTSIGAALVAASDGDVLLVRSGSYDGGVGPGQTDIDGKGVTIVADRGAVVRLEALLVRNLSAAQYVRVRGVELVGNTLLPALWVDGNAGVVWIEDCTITGTVPAPGLPFVTSDGVRVQDSSRLVLARCSITGGGAGAGGIPAGSAVEAVRSRVHLFGCDLLGGPGTSFQFADPGPGGAGLSGLDSFVYAQGASFTGGPGGPGAPFGVCSDSEDGGVGLRTQGSGARLSLLDSVASGGAGADMPNAGCNPGADGSDFEPRRARRLRLEGRALGVEAAGPVRAGETIDLVVRGAAGTATWLVVSAEPAARYAPGLRGPRLNDGPIQLVLSLGSIPAGGTLTASFTAPANPGSEARTFFMQPLGLAPSGPMLGSGQAIAVLDPAF